MRKASTDRLQISPMAVDVPQAAEMIGTSTSFMWKMIKAGKIKTVKLGARRLVPVASIAGLLEGRPE
jgi:excisionase family DNA binding protein